MLAHLTGPYELPALVVLLGLLAVLLGSLRGRTAVEHRRRTLRWAYALAGGMAVVVGLGLGVQHARSFWSAEWDPDASQVRLDRPFPLGDVHIPAERIAFVSEVSAPERTLSGTRRVVRFEVRLESGHSYRSTPFPHTAKLNGLRTDLAAANGGRLERFLVGTRSASP